VQQAGHRYGSAPSRYRAKGSTYSFSWRAQLSFFSRRQPKIWSYMAVPESPRPQRCQPFRVQLSDVFLQHYQERAELKLLCTVQGFSPGSSENWYRSRVEVPAVPSGLMTALLRSSPHSKKWFMQLSRRHRAQTPFYWSAVRKLFNLIPLRLNEH
jgi:hypothetical protein